MAADTRRAPLDIRALRSEIIGSGGPWRQLDVVAETGSTNADLLARSAAGHDIDGSVLLAEYQKAGRGPKAVRGRLRRARRSQCRSASACPTFPPTCGVGCR